MGNPTATRRPSATSSMYRIVEVDTAAQWERFRALGRISAEETDMFPRRRANTFWVLESSSGHPLARCGLWWNATASHVDRRPIGIIGHYYAEDATVGSQMLHFASNRLERE